MCVRLLYPVDSSFDDVAIEASMLQYLNTSNVTPQFFGVVVATDCSVYFKYGIVTEFVGHPVSLEVASIGSLLRANDRAPFLNWVQLCADLVSAVNVINAKGVVMNNGLNSENILLKQNDGHWTVCMCDLSLSCYRDYTFDRKELVDTAHCSAASDMFLAGCVISQIATMTNSCLLRGIADKCRRRNANERPPGRVKLQLIGSVL